MALVGSKRNNTGRDKLHAAGQVPSADPIKAGGAEDATILVGGEGLPDPATGLEPGRVRRIAAPNKVAKRPTKTPEEKRAEMERLSREADPFATSGDEEEEPKAGGLLGVKPKKPLVRKLPVAKPDEQPATEKKKLTLKNKAGNTTIHDMGVEPTETRVAVMLEAHTVGNEAVSATTTKAADDQHSPSTTGEPNTPDSEPAEPTAEEASSNDDSDEDDGEEEDNLATFRGSQREQIAAAFKIFHQPGYSVELRILGAKGGGNKTATVSGYFDHLDPFVRAVIDADKLEGNTYITINPAKLALLARSDNKVVVGPKATTSDHDTEYRNFLLVDLDHKRPAGVAASDEEVKLTRFVGRWLRRRLSKLGWATPVVVDSGNGLHFLYRIDLPNDDHSKLLIQKVLAALAAMLKKKFGDACPVHVDQSVSNAARISRLPGTMNRKGEGTKDRPHRRAKFLHVPESPAVVSREKLESLAGEAPAVNGGASTHPDHPGTTGAMTIRNWLAGPGADLEVTKEKVTSESTIYELAACPFDENHTGGSAFVGQMANGAVFFGCHHNGCAGKDWHALRDLKEPGWREAGKSKSSFADVGKRRSEEFDDPDETWEAVEPLDETSPALRFPVEALPWWMRDYAEAVALATQTPVAAIGSFALAAAATGIQRTAKMEMFLGWLEPLNLYVLVAMPAATRKSEVKNRAFRPIQLVEKSSFVDAAKAQEAHANELKRMEDRKKVLEGQLARATADEEVARLEAELDTLDRAIEAKRAAIPTQQRFIVDDLTPEKAGVLMQENGGRLTYASAEADGLESFMGFRYSKGGANQSIFLKGHAGDDLVIDRITRDPVYIPGAAITLAVMTQPSHMKTLCSKPGMRGRGSMARIVYVIPKSNLGSRLVVAPPVPQEVDQAYSVGIQTLLRRAPDDNPPLLRPSEEARNIFIDFAEEVERELPPGGELGGLVDWAGKFPGLVARLAGIIHVAKVEGPGGVGGKSEEVPVSADTIRGAIELGRFYAANASAAYATMGADPVMADAKFILDALGRIGKPYVEKKELWARTKAHFASRVAPFDEAMGYLRGRGFIRKLPGQRPTGAAKQGRKPAPLYAVNPHYLGLDPDSVGVPRAMGEE